MKNLGIAFSAFVLLFFVHTAATSDIEVETYASGPTWITLSITVSDLLIHRSDISQYKIVYGQGNHKHTRSVRRSTDDQRTMVTITDLEEGELYEFSIRPVFSNRNVGAATGLFARTSGDMGPNNRRGGDMAEPMLSTATKPASTYITLFIFIALVFTLMTAAA